MSTEAEPGVLPPQMTRGRHPPEAGRGGTDSPESPWGSVAFKVPRVQPGKTDFSFLASNTGRMYFCCFKPPRSGPFVTTATGHSHGTERCPWSTRFPVAPALQVCN